MARKPYYVVETSGYTLTPDRDVQRTGRWFTTEIHVVGPFGEHRLNEQQGMMDGEFQAQSGRRYEALERLRSRAASLCAILNEESQWL